MGWGLGVKYFFKEVGSNLGNTFSNDLKTFKIKKMCNLLYHEKYYAPPDMEISKTEIQYYDDIVPLLCTFVSK